MVVTNPEKTGKPGKTLFFSKSLSKPEKVRNFFEKFVTSWKSQRIFF